MVLVHGLLVILASRRFVSVEVSRWVGPCTMGESRLTSWVEISRQVSRRRIGMVQAKTLRPKLRNPPIYYSRRKNSEKVPNEFFQIGSKQIKTGLVNWSKKIKSKTHFEAITTHPFCISAARPI